MAQKTWAVGEEVLAADFNTYVQNQVVPAFTGTTQRDAQWASPPEGALCVTVDTDTLWQRVGSAWMANRPETYNNVVGITSGAFSTTEAIMPGGTVTTPSLAYAHRVRYQLTLLTVLGAAGTVDMHVRYNTTGAAAVVGDTLHRSVRATAAAAGSQATVTAVGSIDRASGATTLSAWGITSGPTCTITTDATTNQLNVYVVPTL